MSSPVMTAQTPSFAERRGGVDLHDVGVRMRRADDVGVQRAGRDRQIVGIAAASRQQRRIFLAKHTACRDAVTLNSPHAGLTPSSSTQSPDFRRESSVDRGTGVSITGPNASIANEWPARKIGRRSAAMPFEIPTPSMTFEVPLEDGARIRMRRHGNPDGVRLLVTHGNGFAADAYYPYWRHLLSKFDVLVFDFRNHGQNVPVDAREPPLRPAQPRPRTGGAGGQGQARPEEDRRHLPFDVGAHRDEARHRDRLALGRAGAVRSARRAARRAIRSMRRWRFSRTS